MRSTKKWQTVQPSGESKKSCATFFYAPQLYRQAEARISYGNSVCLSVCPSRPGAETTEWHRNSGSSPYDSLESLASNEVIREYAGCKRTF